jgi:hypothetical protein
VGRGTVPRAKLYYLRALRGKAARITERGRDTVAVAVPETGTTEEKAS